MAGSAVDGRRTTDARVHVPREHLDAFTGGPRFDARALGFGAQSLVVGADSDVRDGGHVRRKPPRVRASTSRRQALRRIHHVGREHKPTACPPITVSWIPASRTSQRIRITALGSTESGFLVTDPESPAERTLGATPAARRESSSRAASPRPAPMGWGMAVACRQRWPRRSPVAASVRDALGPGS